MRNHVRKYLFVPVVALLVLSSAMTVLAAPGGIQIKPWAYDPYHTGIIQSGWVPGQGLTDAGDNAGQALYLAKNGETAAWASAGATVAGVEGLTVTELGFDYREGGHCGAGAPRFNVRDADGNTAFYGCAAASQTPLGNGWTRVRIYLDPVQVSSIDIVFDEGTDVGAGFIFLDNIDVNGTIAGKPGLSKWGNS